MELQNTLHSFISSSWHQWSEKESLSSTTQSTAEQPPLRRSRGAAILRGAGLGSPVPACPRGGWCWTAMSPFSSSTWGKANGWVFQSNWAELESLWADFELFTHWRMCESSTHHRVRLNIGREQQLPCEVSCHVSTSSEHVRSHPPEHSSNWKGSICSITHGQYNPSEAARCWDTQSLSFISSNNFSGFPLPCW